MKQSGITRLYVWAACAAALPCGCASDRNGVEAGRAAAEPEARLYEGFGNFHRRVTTRSAEAQQWFDQGMQLSYGFNHDEAIRSFRRAASIDPGCAMAWWGVAYAHGMHINNPRMTEEQSRRAYEASREAVRRIKGASPVERALIRAVAERYAWPPPKDHRPLNEAYAEAMGRAWRAHPYDTDVGALYAEALLNLQPWDLWTHEGEPKGRTAEIVGVLERVLALDPNHPGANHFYIHAVEASAQPEKGTASAERLLTLVPGSGHLVHMPSHIFIRTGRYADAADTNERAIATDEAYFALAHPPDFYGLYFLHNVHFLAYASMMEGRYAAALAAGRKIEREIPEEFLRKNVTLADGLMPTTLHVMVRFGKWEEILCEPEPPAWRVLSRAQRHYARAVALANLSRIAEARSEMDRFEDAVGELTDKWYMKKNPALSVVGIARKVAAGEIAYHGGDAETAFELLRQAAAEEDRLVYDEPPGWMQPVRHALGALLLAEGRAAEAEAVYRRDLAKHPNNGWSLLGLEQALRAQGRVGDAELVADRLARVWWRADVTPVASCYCHPAAR